MSRTPLPQEREDIKTTTAFKREGCIPVLLHERESLHSIDSHIFSFAEFEENIVEITLLCVE